MNILLYYYTGRTYMEELPMGSLRGPVEPGQGCRVVSYWRLNNIMNDTVLTSGYAEGLGDVRLDVWEQRRGRRGGGGSPSR